MMATLLHFSGPAMPPQTIAQSLLLIGQTQYRHKEKQTNRATDLPQGERTSKADSDSDADSDGATCIAIGSLNNGNQKCAGYESGQSGSFKHSRKPIAVVYWI